MENKLPICSKSMDLNLPVPAGDAVPVSYAPEASEPLATITGACLPPSSGGPAANNSTAPLAMGGPISTGNQVTSSVPEELSLATHKSPAGFTVTVNGVSIPTLSVQLAQVYIIDRGSFLVLDGWLHHRLNGI